MNHPLTTNMHPVMAAALSPALFAQDAILRMSAKGEAVANADAHLNDAGLPTYSELLAAVRSARALASVSASGQAEIPVDHRARLALVRDALDAALT